MERNELITIFDRQQRQEAEFPGVRSENTGRVIRNIMPNGRFGFIIYSALDESSADQEIEAQIEYFRTLGIGFEWTVYDHDRPADLRQRLAGRGFEIEPPEALLVLDLNDAPETYWTMNLDCVEKVTDPAGLDEIVRMEEDVWGSDHAWIRTRLGHDLLELPDRLSVFTVPADGRVVSAAWIYYYPPTQFASLWGGSTLPNYRRRGYYTALVAARAREARQRGFRYLAIFASPMSRPILEKHGFQFLEFSIPCKWQLKPPEEEPHG